MTDALSEIDLKIFCAVPGLRKEICNPFSYGGWRYATNGKICVRIPAAKKHKRITGSPDAAFLFKKFPERGFRLLYPRLHDEQVTMCDECHGMGGETIDGDWEECRFCLGCSWQFRLAGQTYQNQFLFKILTLPKPRFHFRRSCTGRKLYFISGGGLQGLLMPLNDGGTRE